MNRIKIYSILAAFCFFLSSCGAPYENSITQSEQQNQFRLGDTAPAFKLPDLTGTEVSLAAMKGKFVVIHFATTWCPFCNAEAPSLEQLYKDYKDKGVEVLIIDVKEPKGLVQKKLQDRFEFSFPLLLDEEGGVAASYAPDGVLADLTRDEVVLASNVLIDRDGTIQFFSLLDSQEFDAELIALKNKLDDLLKAQS